MHSVTSKDGTTIAFDRMGTGPSAILVNGALGSRTDTNQQQLASLLAEHFTVFNYDRRGRGDSDDVQPYAVEREIEDIEALIAKAGGTAYMFGMSSGAILALRAAKHLGSKITRLALYEPPLILDHSRPPLPGDYVKQLNNAIADGDRSKAVEIFMTQAILVPEEYLAPMKADPMWAGMEKVAHTLAYDGMVSREFMAGKPWTIGLWNGVTAKTLVITGENSETFFDTTAQKLASDLADAENRVLPGQDHNVAMDALAPMLIEFFKEGTLTFLMKLELIPIPVTDIDLSKTFYADKVGFNVDHDVTPSDGVRIIQLTPPGSTCSIVLGKGVGEFDQMQPGAVKGLHLVVDDIATARETLLTRGVDMGEIDDMGRIKYAAFSDPDGNSWTLQEITQRS
jgi:pimeloyl-ACP methyl ester carboxylesterase/predicted enzyme related to lactoylglutathione lyase